MNADHLTPFWSMWVAAITLIVIFGCLALLLAIRKSETHKEETEADTGHEFDGIRELDNPLPKWWYYKFLILTAFGLIYLVLYPGLGNFKGVLGWSQEGQWQAEMVKAETEFAPVFAKLAEGDAISLAQNPEAMKAGSRLFRNNCAICHGQNAQGGYGFPNLTDNDWLYGGDPATLQATLNGGRGGIMPSFAKVLGDEGIENMSHYVVSLSGRQHDLNKAAQAAPAFKANCAACHGADGQGNPMLGAPNLTDNVWLYKHPNLTVRGSVELTLQNGRQGQMPVFKHLGEDKVKLLSAYVYSLSN
ncbi:cytochrome-c oxidase, cbb3-type subunit III [Litorivicinus lipolyticus]|uniref:Cbb3-type cytochrome c oxidase subunit n=1 Tax=Litorivicinus lipolyticus TaxID=418701 RepID=A0A5Q2QEB2_9GAMM|nr:cytochrome-c oxidase, cbb3-type subunit III [Litorivicinus lipolyticus]QGG80366.1 cytochrome-c oxidase, cbb3-type subunit III [Litorivicinus lipolyticus]